MSSTSEILEGAREHVRRGIPHPLWGWTVEDACLEASGRDVTGAMAAMGMLDVVLGAAVDYGGAVFAAWLSRSHRTRQEVLALLARAAVQARRAEVARG